MATSKGKGGTYLIVLYCRLILSVLLAIFGIALYFCLYPLLVQYIIESEIMVLTPESRYFHTWAKNEVPRKTSIYLFEITNGRNFLEGEKPNLQEHGPFVFNHYKNRINVTWLEDGRKISYYEISFYKFDRQQSVSGLNSLNITVINLPLMVLIHNIVNELNRFTSQAFISSFISRMIQYLAFYQKESLIERRTPGEILFGRTLYLYNDIENLVEPLRMIGVPISKLPIKSPLKIGYLTYLNNTVTGPYIGYTGQRSFQEILREFDLENRNNYLVQFFLYLFGLKLSPDFVNDNYNFLNNKFLEIFSYQNKRHNSIYGNSSCSAIKGTDGSGWNPYKVRNKESLFLYNGICRPLGLVFERDMPFNNLLTVNRYQLRNDTFSMANKANWCFCVGSNLSANNYKFNQRVLKCDGHHDMQTCSKHTPLTVSFPHFLFADRLRAHVDGLMPKFDDHYSFLDIEKTYGLTINAKVRFQFNVKVESMYSSTYGRLRYKPSIVPYVWFTESGELTYKDEMMLSSVVALIYFGYGLCMLIVLGGFVLFVVVLFNYKILQYNPPNSDAYLAELLFWRNITFDSKPFFYDEEQILLAKESSNSITKTEDTTVSRLSKLTNARKSKSTVAVASQRKKTMSQQKLKSIILN